MIKTYFMKLTNDNNTKYPKPMTNVRSLEIVDLAQLDMG